MNEIPAMPIHTGDAHAFVSACDAALNTLRPMVLNLRRDLDEARSRQLRKAMEHLGIHLRSAEVRLEEIRILRGEAIHAHATSEVNALMPKVTETLPELEAARKALNEAQERMNKAQQAHGWIAARVNRVQSHADDAKREAALARNALNSLKGRPGVTHSSYTLREITLQDELAAIGR